MDRCRLTSRNRHQVCSDHDEGDVGERGNTHEEYSYPRMSKVDAVQTNRKDGYPYVNRESAWVRCQVGMEIERVLVVMMIPTV